MKTRKVCLTRNLEQQLFYAVGFSHRHFKSYGQPKPFFAQNIAAKKLNSVIVYWFTASKFYMLKSCLESSAKIFWEVFVN